MPKSFSNRFDRLFSFLNEDDYCLLWQFFVRCGRYDPVLYLVDQPDCNYLTVGFGLSLYIKKPKPALAILLIIDILNTLLLAPNIIFYRESQIFITVKSVLGFSKVSQGLSGSSFSLMKPHDVI